MVKQPGLPTCKTVLRDYTFSVTKFTLIVAITVKILTFLRYIGRNLSKY